LRYGATVDSSLVKAGVLATIAQWVAIASAFGPPPAGRQEPSEPPLLRAEV
jgi:hypothetical protein